MTRTLLAIETSCDETSAAIIRDGAVSSLVIASQIDHDSWGGVVPELASRAHLRAIGPALRRALEEANAELGELDAIAVTIEPGLIGSLLVGVNAAKGLAVGLGRPLIEVNHLEAHLYSVLIDEPDLAFPYIGLVVSGGHTLLYRVDAIDRATLMGSTRDDAAGEAFDKGAKLLGLGYPGGPEIDRIAAYGNPKAHQFPRGLQSDPADDFSFSGLKTSLRYYLRDHHPDTPPVGRELADLCASYQEAIVDALVSKTVRAAVRDGVPTVAAVGGVSANSRLRAKLREAGEAAGLGVHVTRPIYSTDNAAMIGLVGWHKLAAGAFAPLTTVARASTVRSSRGRKHQKKGSAE
jgi:N6-L-threonylcarbamoyladenine synthase